MGLKIRREEKLTIATLSLYKSKHYFPIFCSYFVALATND